ncbi:flavin reductase family protein [Nocardioides sp. TF02-7]|uniref:flavin reductase family protein n=1 Tax=Nocardioides sp. TF02-7 TaxID=2917724 RepID=UPI0031F4CD33
MSGRRAAGPRRLSLPTRPLPSTRDDPHQPPVRRPRAGSRPAAARPAGRRGHPLVGRGGRDRGRPHRHLGDGRDGARPALLALLDPDSDLLAELRDTGRAVVHVLTWPDRQLAEAFAGTAPAPGGPFRQAEFVATAYGPRLATATTWADVTLAGEREVGWSVEVTATLDAVTVGEDERPLLHRRGRFRTLD